MDMTDVTTSQTQPEPTTTQTTNPEPQQQEVDVWESEEFDINNNPEAVGGSDTDEIGGEHTETEEQTDKQQPEDEVSESNVSDWEAKYKEQIQNPDAKLDKPILLKVKGKIIELDTVNDIRDLAERGIGSTAKFQEMAEQRKFIQELENAGISKEDIDLLVKARRGDAEAANALLGKEPPQQVQTQDTTVSPEAEAVAQEIIDAPYANEAKEALSLIPEEQRNQLVTNPQFLRGIKTDFERGVAQKLMPKVEKYVLVNGMDFLSAYAKAGQEVFGNGVDEKAKTLTSKPRVGSSVMKQEPQDPWSMDDETFRRAMENIRN
jgi:hypothetical protein